MNEIVKVTSGKDLLQSYAEQKQARQIFGRYIYEGELSILFGDSNSGKSILANDIAFFVSGGGHEWEGMESPLLPALYIDMEMTGSQFARRYATAADYMTKFYYRAEVNMNSTDDKWNFIRNKIITMQGQDNPPKFIVLDNITNGFGSIFSAKKMLSLVAELKTLKDRYGLTILLIAHCPKRNKNKPITQDSLGGSKMIINFVDSAFAVGTSLQEESVRYVKQIKSRECSKDNEVMTVRIKTEPYLSMQYIDKVNEDVHLGGEYSMSYYEISPTKEIELCKYLSDNRTVGSGTFMSYFEISEKTGIPFNVIAKYHRERFNTQNED